MHQAEMHKCCHTESLNKFTTELIVLIDLMDDKIKGE